jgi:XTP/dITP diphosphohydrolase
MSAREIRFVTSNPFKVEEARAILAVVDVSVVPFESKIEELQTTDAEQLVRDKALRAFDRVHGELFVEHTGLFLAHLNGLPGGLTQIFWDTLQADRFAELFGRAADPSVVARTTIGYIDGRRFYFFRGDVEGIITELPRGSREFQWDCVFQPMGETETFAEMGGARKNAISMRRRALDSFATFLKAGR